MGEIAQSAYWTKIGHFWGEFEPLLWPNSKWFQETKNIFLDSFFTRVRICYHFFV